MIHQRRLSVDLDPPGNASVQVGDGSGVITDHTAVVHLTADDGLWMVEHRRDLSRSALATLRRRSQLSFSNTEGAKTVYAVFKDAADNETAIVSDQTELITSGILEGQVFVEGQTDASQVEKSRWWVLPTAPRPVRPGNGR